MNILVAPNSMKGSLSAFQFAGVVEKAFYDAAPTFFKIRKLPVADGGDDTVKVLTNALDLAHQKVAVSDPLGRMVQATYGYAKGTAVIEMASASGMKLLNLHELNPMKTSSYGTGQLMLDAIQKGANKIYIGIGGSATVDGGMGMLEALGFQFLDGSQKPLKGNGENLGKINQINTSHSLITNDIEIIILSDVDNPLLGPQGAARVFGPQKGATPQMVESLESNLSHYAGIIKKSTSKDVTRIKGGGAAGGISVALSAFMNSQIVAGADFILDLISIDEYIQWADLVITGEGMIDSQTLMNKAPYAVAMRAKKFGKPVIGLAGSISLPKNKLFDGLFSIINKPMSLEEAIENVAELTYQSSYELALLISKLQSINES